MSEELRDRLANAIADSRNFKPDGSCDLSVKIEPTEGDFLAADFVIRSLHSPGVRKLSRDQQRAVDWMNSHQQAVDFDIKDALGLLMQRYHQDLEELSQLRKLARSCQQFISQHKISCAESVYQRDAIWESAPELVENVCEILGYHQESC